MTIFHLVLIRPSHYDSEGYVIQWLGSNVHYALDLEELEMFSQTDAARVAVQIHQEKQRARV